MISRREAPPGPSSSKGLPPRGTRRLRGPGPSGGGRRCVWQHAPATAAVRPRRAHAAARRRRQRAISQVLYVIRTCGHLLPPRRRFSSTPGAGRPRARTASATASPAGGARTSKAAALALRASCWSTRPSAPYARAGRAFFRELSAAKVAVGGGGRLLRQPGPKNRPAVACEVTGSARHPVLRSVS